MVRRPKEKSRHQLLQEKAPSCKGFFLAKLQSFFKLRCNFFCFGQAAKVEIFLSLSQSETHPLREGPETLTQWKFEMCVEAFITEMSYFILQCETLFISLSWN